MEYASIKDFPRFTIAPGYHVDCPWDYVEEWLTRMGQSFALEVDPDFQRGHVWTPAQQSRYIEFRLRGGETAAEIFWNAAGWNKSHSGPMLLVDGLQRLTAVRRWMADKVPVFGKTFSQYPDAARYSGLGGPMLRLYVNDLPTRADVLRWYLEINAGGTPHPPEELARVNALLEAERVK